MNKKAYFFKKKFSFFLILIISIPLFSASNKSNKNDVYKKYVHPRTYEFDLCDSEKKVFLGYVKSADRFEGTVNFTKYVRKDMPQAGDKVTFYFSGYCKKEAKVIYADVFDGERNLTQTGGKLFTPYIHPNETFEGSISFILKEDAREGFSLKLWSSMKNVPWQLDQCYLKFTRIVESTDTVKEAEAEQKALKNNIEIVEVQSEISSAGPMATGIALTGLALVQPEVSTSVLLDESVEKAALIAAELAAQEETKRIAAEKEAARIEAERLAKIELERQETLRKEKEKLELERKKQEEELQKAIDAVKSVSRYEKEYLNDYMVFDEPSLSSVEENIEELIAEPDEKDSFGRTLLMKAAKAGNDWQIKTLLKSGANVNLKDKDGWTALMYAVRYQESIACVDLLLDAGADVKNINNYNSSALTLAACYNNNPEVLRKMLSYYYVTDKDVLKSLVLLLSENQTSEYIQLAKLNIYLDISIPLNTFYEGKTPLMYAAEYGNSTKVLKSLMDYNAITSVRSTEGKTAYDYASKNKNLKHDEYYWALNKK